MLKKTGVPLRDILPRSEDDCVQRLRDDFSITTAEELFCACQSRHESMQAHLRLSDERWAALTEAVETALPLPVRQMLVVRPSQSFGKGLKMQAPPKPMLDGLKKYTSRG